MQPKSILNILKNPFLALFILAFATMNSCSPTVQNSDTVTAFTKDGPLSNQENFSTIIENLAAIEIVFSGADSQTKVTSDITLPNELEDGLMIEWASSDETILTSSGTLTLPTLDFDGDPNKDPIVLLTATVYYDDIVFRRQFSLTVSRAFWEEGETSATINSGGLAQMSVDNDLLIYSWGLYDRARLLQRGGNGSWTNIATLTPSTTTTPQDFGSSLSVSGDTIIVGSPREDFDGSGIENADGSHLGVANGSNGSGAAFIFRADDTQNWYQDAYLKASDSEHDIGFGSAVDIQDNHAVVGAYARNRGDLVGAIYTFLRDENGNWSQEAKLLPTTDNLDIWFGAAVAVNGDTMIVGAPNVGGTDGYAFIFEKVNGEWIQTAELYNTLAGDFGTSVDLEGRTAVVSSPSYDNNKGAVFVYRKINGIWQQVGQLQPTGSQPNDKFGHSLSISNGFIHISALNEYNSLFGISNADGSKQTPIEDLGSPEYGAVYIFRENMFGQWVQDVYIRPQVPPSSGFGLAVSSDFPDLFVLDMDLIHSYSLNSE